MCIKHYTRYKKARNRLPPEQRDEFDSYLIERGQLMPVRPGRRAAERDEFADAVAAFMARQPSDASSAEQIANHLVDEATSEQAEQEPPKKGRGARRKKV